MDVLSEEADVLQTAFPGSNREVVTNVVNFCLEPHPVAALIKPLQFSWDSHQWPDGKVTYWIKIEGPNPRECFLNDRGRPILLLSEFVVAQHVQVPTRQCWVRLLQARV